MAVEFGQFKLGQRKKREAESLAAALEREARKESGLQSILGYAVPLLAGLALPITGGFSAGLLGGTSIGSGLASLGSSSLGKMALGTLGTRGLGEAIEGLARAAGQGGDAKNIAESGGLFGRREAQKYASKFKEMQGDDSSEWLSSILSGASFANLDPSNIFSGPQEGFYDFAEQKGKSVSDALINMFGTFRRREPKGLMKYETYTD